MAPELFQDGATHSTASDLWAVGCVLYECYVGRPPFMNTSFNQLVQNILNVEYAAMANVSPEFADLVKRLLDKNPATRMTWVEMLTHPFWQFTMAPVQMPREPALERFIKLNNLAPGHEEQETQSLIGALHAGERAKMCGPHPLSRAPSRQRAHTRRALQTPPTRTVGVAGTGSRRRRRGQ